MALGLTKDTASMRLEAGLRQLLDNGDLGVKGDQIMNVLESVARAYLDQFHALGQLHM